MARDDTPPEDIQKLLPGPEDLARVLDRRALKERSREAVEKAAQNANFASAMEALNALPHEEPPKEVQPSERAEYNAAKTIPPKTRRDTLELHEKIEVAPELLDPRHRPTAKIVRAPAPANADSARPVSTPPAPPVEPAPEQASPRRRWPWIAVLAAAVAIGAIAVVSRPGGVPNQDTSAAAPPRATAAAAPRDVPTAAPAATPSEVVTAPPPAATASASSTAEEPTASAAPTAKSSAAAVAAKRAPTERKETAAAPTAPAPSPASTPPPTADKPNRLGLPYDEKK